MYLYRAVDSEGDTIDFMLSPNRDLTAAKHFLQLALWRTKAVWPRVINVDGHPAYSSAIAELKGSGELGRRCRWRPCPYLNDIVEQDHRFIKKRIAASLWFRSAEGARQTIAGYEAMHAIRKGQSDGFPKGMLSVRFNSSSASSALPPDHWHRRFNPRPLYTVCEFATDPDNLYVLARNPA